MRLFLLQIGSSMGFVTDGFLAVLNSILQGLFDFVGEVFSVGIRRMLFFESPYNLSGPNAAFGYNLKLALALLPIIIAIGIFSMPFANRHKAAIWRQGWRVVEVLIFIALARPALHIALVVVNVTGEYIFPSSYDLTFAGQGVFDSLVSVGVTGFGLLVGGYLLSGVSILGILFLFFVLFLREFLFHMIYQGFPILIIAWYLDWGPFKPANHIAVMIFRLTAYLVLVGPLIALALQVGTVFGGGSWPPDGSIPPNPETTVEFWRQLAGWFMGIALASAFGLKAAMMGGVPISQITNPKKTSSRNSSTTKSEQDPARVSISEQTKYLNDRFNEKTQQSGISSTKIQDQILTTKDRVVGKWSEISDRNDIRGGTARTINTIKDTLTPVGKRAISDFSSGGKYAVTHLDESPVKWGQSGIDHYRNNPIISNHRRAMELINRQPTESMRKEELAEQMGWPTSKTNQIIEDLERSGQLRINETDSGSIVMNSTRFSDRPADHPTDRPQQDN